MSQTEVQLIKNNAVVEADIANDAVTRDKINVVSTSSAPGIEIKGDDGSQEGYLQLNCRVNSHGVKIQSPPHSASQSYKIILPDNQIAADKVLKVKSITGSGSTATGQLEFADAPGGGKVIQVIHKSASGSASTSSGSYQDYSDLTQAITLSNSSNKVLVSLDVQWQAYGDQDRRIEVRLYHTSISDSNAITQNAGGEYKSGSSNSYSFGTINQFVLDVPGSTSRTYKVGYRSIDGSDVGLQGESSGRSRSTLTLMEISA